MSYVAETLRVLDILAQILTLRVVIGGESIKSKFAFYIR